MAEAQYLTEFDISAYLIGEPSAITVKPYMATTGTYTTTEFFRWNYVQNGDGPVTRIPEYRTVTRTAHDPVDLAGGSVTITWECGSKSGTVGTGTLDNQGRITMPWVVDEQIAYSDLSKTQFSPKFHVTAQKDTHHFSSTVTSGSLFAIPSTVKPVVTDYGVSEGNPEIVPGMPFIQGYSRIKAAPTVVGTYGSPIVNMTVKLGNLVVPPEGLAAPNWGVQRLHVTATDARGRTIQSPDQGLPNPNASTEVAVAEYSAPDITLKVDRVNEAGILDQSGAFLRATINTRVSFLGGANGQQVRLFTKPKDASTWTARNVINPPNATYAGSVVIDGGEIFDRSQAWLVRAEVEDAALTSTVETPVASGGVIMDSDRGHTAIGMYVDPDGPPVQLAGPVRVYGLLDTPNLPEHRQTGVKPAGTSSLTVPLVGFKSIPEVTLTPVTSSIAQGPTVWLTALSNTSMTIRSSSADVTVYYAAEQYPYVPAKLTAVKEPASVSIPDGNTTIIVARYADPGVMQYLARGSSTRTYPVENGAFINTPPGSTKYQWGPDWVVAWIYHDLGQIGRFAVNDMPWLAPFRAEAYAGILPVENATDVTKRLARELGLTVTPLGPQFD